MSPQWCYLSFDLEQFNQQLQSCLNLYQLKLTNSAPIENQLNEAGYQAMQACGPDKVAYNLTQRHEFYPLGLNPPLELKAASCSAHFSSGENIEKQAQNDFQQMISQLLGIEQNWCLSTQALPDQSNEHWPLPQLKNQLLTHGLTAQQQDLPIVTDPVKLWLYAHYLQVLTQLPWWQAQGRYQQLQSIFQQIPNAQLQGLKLSIDHSPKLQMNDFWARGLMIYPEQITHDGFHLYFPLTLRPEQAYNITEILKEIQK